MRVVHIAWLYGLNNTGGACMAATRLHLALLKEGVESHYICVQQRENGQNVHEVPARGLMRGVQYVLTRIVWLLGYLTPKRGIMMPNLVPMLTLEKTLKKLNPDVVHVHWYMMDTISFCQLANMPYPVVMTLHDLFDVSIEDPFPTTDRRYIEGLSRSNANWYERWLFDRKHRAMAKCKPVMLGPSKWICDTAATTIIGGGLQYHVVGNVFDSIYTFVPSLCETHEKFRILFGASGGRTVPRKGWADFVKAIPFLPSSVKENSEVIVFGETAQEYSQDGLHVRFVGNLSSPAELRATYHHADVLVLPSLLDNAPNVKFEGWFCGLLVVAFGRSGCAEFINQGENGWVAADGDYRGFADGIAYFYELWKGAGYSELRKRIASQAQSKFNAKAIVHKFLEVYSEASDRKKSSDKDGVLV